MSIANIMVYGQKLPAVEESRPDATKIIAGDPLQRTWNYYESSDGKLYSGIWEAEPGTWRINYDEAEYCIILEGQSRLTDEHGAVLELRPGSAIFIPPGFKGTWEVVTRTRKHYVIYL
ncbi:cupin domain-containing protein [Limibacillus halophilus]|uniref:(S)-ureidoglycine aminohydrolase cupin domain-containing protein n=1 Tax=Limibacillus halophilus TaxID=1579333 RepID=A0A839SY37_9PROT|nr:cupin domain-containing protein [Limibacillus halophilus]MBB3066446.1 hypothetical protein [Limibacillus halophilus]